MDSVTSFGPYLIMGLMAFMVFRMAPGAINQLKNGPKGSSSEWLNGLLLLAAVAAFVYFLISIV